MKSRFVNKNYNFLKLNFFFNLIRSRKNFDVVYIVSEELIKKK